MRKRQIEKWFKWGSPLVLLAGVGGALAIVLAPYQLTPDPPVVTTSPVQTAKALPPQSRMANLLDRRFFSKPKPVPVVVKQPRAPAVRWPQFKLDCIFIGKTARLAVFSSNNQTYSKTEGEKFLDVVIQSIEPGKVELEFNGVSKTFLTATQVGAAKTGAVKTGAERLGSQ